MEQAISIELLNWYRGNARNLPWRKHPEPYTVWVSEIMLQQTRVEMAIPYFERWMVRFPTINDLSNATLQDVLVVWEGLGYYNRARNLHQAAQIVMSEHGGELPGDPNILLSLPGIGRYTAGAISSIAFGKDEPALDGNIRRVLARLFNVSEPARSAKGERRFWELASDLLPEGRAGEFNQALMDLGALVCTPKSPNCTRCPLRSFCLAHALSIQEQRPVVMKKTRVPHYTATAGIMIRAEKVLITQRPIEGLLGGMWEFPGGKVLSGENLVSCLQRKINEKIGVNIAVNKSLGIYRHAYTHFRVTLHAFFCKIMNGDNPRRLQVEDIDWPAIPELVNYPMGKIDRQIAEQIEGLYQSKSL